MKKAIVILLMLALAVSAAYAANDQSGQQIQTTQQTVNQGEAQQVQTAQAIQAGQEAGQQGAQAGQGQQAMAQAQNGPGAQAGQGQQAMAQAQNGQGAQAGQGQQAMAQTQGNGQAGQGQMLGQRAQSTEQLRQMVQQKQQSMQQEMTGKGNAEQKVYQNQNRVREAVHALQAMEGLVGGIGPQVSAVAREFNNSVQATIRAEEKIEKRSSIARFFAGGDAEAAEQLLQETERNQERIRLLNQLKAQCECSEEVKAMFQEQVQNMELEQNRLKQRAQAEKQSKGMFGWLWK